MFANPIENTIFKCIVGSQAYGTNIETSDIDIKGIYKQSNEEILGYNYKEQINIDKDTTYYEVKRFIDLCSNANPTMLEMLFSEPDMILKSTNEFDFIQEHKQKFLTKQCYNSYCGYAVAQIKKAKGLDKKVNWKADKKERKTPIDFCYIMVEGKSVLIEKWLEKNKQSQNYIGLCGLSNMPNCFSVYYDWNAHYDNNLNSNFTQSIYSGVCFENSNDIKLSSIPKEQICYGVLYYNKDAYSKHCKEYNEYQEWLKNSNEQRRVDTTVHGQQIDGKNLMHCVRLLDTAMEIVTNKTITNFRPNREYLLSIRKGKIDLETLIEQCENQLLILKPLFENSDLPDNVCQKFKNKLLLKIRNC